MGAVVSGRIETYRRRGGGYGIRHRAPDGTVTATRGPFPSKESARAGADALVDERRRAGLVGEGSKPRPAPALRRLSAIEFVRVVGEVLARPDVAPLLERYRQRRVQEEAVAEVARLSEQRPVTLAQEQARQEALWLAAAALPDTNAHAVMELAGRSELVTPLVATRRAREAARRESGTLTPAEREARAVEAWRPGGVMHEQVVPSWLR